MAEERSGFLGRWARRKTEALQGKPLDEPVRADNARPAPVAGVAAAKPGPVAFAPAPAAAEPDASANAPLPEKPLSLEDVKALTQDSDFKPFMARDVGSDVRNAAMKKLFADPHYNVMDGLDIYIDDYSKPDPLPQAMLRQMASAKFLKLFEDEESDKAGKNAIAQGDAAAQADAMAASADDCLKPPDVQSLSQPDTDTVAQCAEPLARARADSLHSFSAEPAAGSGASQDNHAHSHLRLQPDHAAPAPNAGHGA